MNTMYRHRAVWRAAVAAVALVSLGACGSTSSTHHTADPQASSVSPSSSAPGTTAPGTTDPCAITTPAAIQQVVGGTVADGVPGHARNCEYAVDGGAVRTVAIFQFGTAAEFEGIESGYQANRGPLETIPDIGADAFSPGDVGQNEIVVRAGDTVFAVGVNAVSATTINPEVKELAARIATALS
jgi:hypothetical protein